VLPGLEKRVNRCYAGVCMVGLPRGHVNPAVTWAANGQERLRLSSALMQDIMEKDKYVYAGLCNVGFSEMYILAVTWAMLTSWHWLVNKRLLRN
jgi:hypothetical protein